MTTIRVKRNSDATLTAWFDGDYAAFTARQLWNGYFEPSRGDMHVPEFHRRFVPNSGRWVAACDSREQKEKDQESFLHRVRTANGSALTGANRTP
jgi:hypothetical protein